MKDFHSWIADMSNSIEDTSTFIKPTFFSSKSLTILQKRKIVADMLVPIVTTQDQFDDWLTAFCVGMTQNWVGRRELTEIPIRHVLGDDLCNEYIELPDTDKATMTFFAKLKKHIGDV